MLHNVPDQLAAAMGLRVDEVPLDDDWPHGLWVPERRQIILRYGLDRVTRRCVLAHELGHAIRGDTLTGAPRLDARAERAADQIAAQLLISPAEYAAAEAIYGPHPPPSPKNSQSPDTCSTSGASTPAQQPADDAGEVQPRMWMPSHMTTSR